MRASAPRGLRAAFAAREHPRPGAARLQPGRTRQQPQRRARLGPRAALPRRPRRERARDRDRRRRLPASSGAPAQLATGWLSDHTGRKPLITRRHARPGRRARACSSPAAAPSRPRSPPRCCSALGTAHGLPDADRRRLRRQRSRATAPARSASTASGATSASSSAPSIAGIGADASSPQAAILIVAAAHRRQRPRRCRHLMAAPRRPHPAEPCTRAHESTAIARRHDGR